jgi:hypothetical protein
MTISSTAMADYSTDFEGWVTADLDTMPGWSRVGAGNVIIGDTPNLGLNLTDRVQIGGAPSSARFVPEEADQFAQGTLEFDLMMNAALVPSHPAFLLYLVNDGSNVVQAVWLRIASENNAGTDDLDLFVFHPGFSSGTVKLTDFMTRDTWYTIKVDFDAVAQTYDFSVDDVLLLDDEPAWGNAGEVNRIQWQNANGYYVQIDNVSWRDAVSVPVTPLEVDIDLAVDAVEISFPTTIGFDYQPQYTEDLSTGNSWSNLGSSIAGDGGTNSTFDTPLNALLRAYRVEQQ